MIGLASSCNTAHSGSQGTWLKVVPECSYLSLQTLLLQDASFSQTTHRKNESKKTRTFFQTQLEKPRAHAAQWFIADYLLLRTWEDRHRKLCSSRLNGLSLGSFISLLSSNRLIARLYSRQRFVLVTYTARRSQYDRLSKQQLSFLLLINRPMVASVPYYYVVQNAGSESVSVTYVYIVYDPRLIFDKVSNNMKTFV